MRPWQNELERVTPEIWSNCIDNVEDIIEDWWKREAGFDKNGIAKFIIILDANDRESDSSFTDDSD